MNYYYIIENKNHLTYFCVYMHGKKKKKKPEFNI